MLGLHPSLRRIIVSDIQRRLTETSSASHGRSAESEHTEILNMVLHESKHRSFIDVLKSMPNVGEDADFDRHGKN
jgi:plasmid stability protein